MNQIECMVLEILVFKNGKNAGSRRAANLRTAAIFLLLLRHTLVCVKVIIMNLVEKEVKIYILMKEVIVQHCNLQ